MTAGRRARTRRSSPVSRARARSRDGIASQVNDRRRWFLVCAVLILAIAAVVRIDGLGSGGLDHTELYVPGIDLPEISHPGPRHSVRETVRSVLRRGRPTLPATT